MKIPRVYKISDIEDFFIGEKMSSFEREYAAFHKYRYQYILNIIEALRPLINEVPLQVLDIGPKCQTNLIREFFGDVHVNSLGYQWEHNRMTGEEYHITVDLNKTDQIDISGHNKNHVVVFAEVVEHLYTMPEVILDFVSRLMKPGAYMILQTPNAVALDRRLKMLMGYNPYDLIEINRQNHYREYTLPELRKMAEESGFKIISSSITNYFNPNETTIQRIYNRLNYIMPQNLRSGITMIVQKIL